MKRLIERGIPQQTKGSILLSSCMQGTRQIDGLLGSSQIQTLHVLIYVSTRPYAATGAPKETKGLTEWQCKKRGLTSFRPSTRHLSAIAVAPWRYCRTFRVLYSIPLVSMSIGLLAFECLVPKRAGEWRRRIRSRLCQVDVPVSLTLSQSQWPSRQRT